MECAHSAANLIRENRVFIKKVVFPVEILPWVAIGHASFRYFVAMTLLLIAYVGFKSWPPIEVILIPLFFLPFALIILGLIWMISSLATFVRDVAHLLNTFLPILMFASPVFYPLSALPEPIQTILVFNPLTFPLEQTRAVLFGAGAVLILASPLSDAAASWMPWVIGSAFVVQHRLGGNAMRFHMDHGYWGPGAANAEVTALLERKAGEIQAEGCAVERIPDEGGLCRRTAQSITEGKVIGWFQGRMEWGPRALGNRSILGDPRRADMKDILNLKIKRRESFRPFAPSILREHVAEWFEQEDDVPFMMEVFQVRPEKRALVPATTHVDGSGRLQTVHRETNPRYHRLIETFRELTGVPMVLNTSFNENEPVVCRPEEALDCFLRTKMDVLVLNDWVVERSSQP